MEIRPVEEELFRTEELAGKWTDTTKLIVAFHNSQKQA